MKLNVSRRLTFSLVDWLTIGLTLVAFSKGHILSGQLIQKVITLIPRRTTHRAHLLLQLRLHPNSLGAVRLNGCLLLSMPPRWAHLPTYPHYLLSLLLCHHLCQLVGLLDTLISSLWGLRGSSLAHAGRRSSTWLDLGIEVLGLGGTGYGATSLAQFAVWSVGYFWEGLLVCN